MMKTLFIGGVPDNGKADVVTTPKGDLSVVVSGSSNLSHYLAALPGDKAQFYLAGKGGDQRYALNFFPDVIINEISDADSHRAALQRCVAFSQQQAKPVFNSPEAMLGTTRDAIAQRLQGFSGLQVPTTIKEQPLSPQSIVQAIERSGMTYPVIFRAAGDHGGVSTVLLKSAKDVERTTYAYALDGRDYYLTQFVDYRSGDGLYRKYRLAVVGGKVFLRHLIISEHWLVHAAARNKAEQTIIEEQRMLETFQRQLAPLIQPVINDISGLVGLDYFGIDCAINDEHEVLVFEANANMNMLVNPNPSPNIWERPVADIIQALITLIKTKVSSDVS